MEHPKGQLGDRAAHGERHPLVEMLVVAAPTVVTMTSYTVMQFIDGLMVSRIRPPDPVYVAAQGNGAMAAFVPIAVVMGLLGVVNTYVSQNLGAGRPERGAAYGWNALWISVYAWLALLPYALFIPVLFGWMGHSERLAELETEYAQILLFGAVLTLATRGIAHYFYGMHRPLPVMIAALVGNVVNVLANYVLIFGAWGAPELGIRGAALGTIIGTAVELVIPMAVFLGPRFNRLYGTRAAWRPSWRRTRDIFRIGWPAGLMFGNEMLCWGYFMVYLIAVFGEVHNTAGWIGLRYMHLSFMPAVGISIAVTALVGRCMGMGRPDLAAKRAWLGMAVTCGYMTLCAVAFVVFRTQLVALFIPADMPDDVARELIRIGSMVMIIAAVFQIFDGMAITMSGALRGAGDTVWPGMVTIVLAWGCIVGGGHLLIAFAPGLGSLGPWIGAAAFIILLGIALLWRFLGGKWRTIDLLSRDDDEGWPASRGAETLPEAGETVGAATGPG